MAKDQTWMKIHSGLNEPKHRDALGVRLWYFMYLIDHADWDTGVVWFYTDQTAADEMEAPLRTVRNWRRDIESAGYITAKQGFQCQHIYIHKWCNPRLKNPQQQNVPGEPSTWSPKVVTHRYPDLGTHPTREVVTPTYDSQSFSHSIDGDTQQDANGDEKLTPHQAMMGVLEEVCGTPIAVMPRRYGEVSKILRDAGRTPDDVKYFGEVYRTMAKKQGWSNIPFTPSPNLVAKYIHWVDVDREDRGVEPIVRMD